MKLKSSLFTIAATGALVASSYGQAVIDITGSTAGRSAVDSRIKALLTGETIAYNGGTGSANCNRAIYIGSFDNNPGVPVNLVPVIIRTFWSGSAAGVRDVSNSVVLANQFLLTTTPTSVAGTAIANGVSLAPATPILGNPETNTVAEISFSDVFQTSTSFQTNPLTEVQVGVIPFQFFKNDGGAAALTNITPGQFGYLYGSLGEAPLSLFTGNAGDAGVTVYAAGRNNESGTRITALADVSFGIDTEVNQYLAADTVAPLDTDDGVLDDGIAFVGNSGAASGGTLATLMGCTYAGGTIVTYLGTGNTGDALTATGAGATALSYNGVTFSEDRVRNGQYSFWGYLHQGKRTSTNVLTGDKSLFFDALALALQGTPGTGLILKSTMNVERTADGAAISPL